MEARKGEHQSGGQVHQVLTEGVTAGRAARPSAVGDFLLKGSKIEKHNPYSKKEACSLLLTKNHSEVILQGRWGK